MIDVRVICITKPHPHSPHEHITHLGGVGWKWTRDEVIARIDGETYSFYMLDSHGAQ